MRLTNWVTAAALLLVPAVAGAEGVLSAPHERLGAGVEKVVEGNYRAAVPILMDALTMDNSMPEAHYNLGVAFRELGRNAEAIREYRAASKLFAHGDESNQSKCLYGIALASESIGDPATAAAAWNDYIAFAGRYRDEQPAVHIARNHLIEEQRLAGIKVTPPGTQKAGR